ncbi:MAG: hypothetical protein WCH34_04890 [Bacteroidota bacterium]
MKIKNKKTFCLSELTKILNALNNYKSELEFDKQNNYLQNINESIDKIKIHCINESFLEIRQDIENYISDKNGFVQNIDLIINKIDSFIKLNSEIK